MKIKLKWLGFITHSKSVAESVSIDWLKALDWDCKVAHVVEITSIFHALMVSSDKKFGLCVCVCEIWEVVKWILIINNH